MRMAKADYKKHQIFLYVSDFMTENVAFNSGGFFSRMPVFLSQLPLPFLSLSTHKNSSRISAPIFSLELPTSSEEQ